MDSGSSLHTYGDSTNNGTLTVASGANLTVEQFTFQNDGTITVTCGGSVTGTISGNPPVIQGCATANNDSYSTDEDTALTVAAPGVLGNDTDPANKPLTAVKVSDPAHGTLTLNSSGSFTYMPAANYNGADSFTYKANNGASNSNVATVSITVNAVNDAPTAISLSNNSVAENEPSDTTVGSFATTDVDTGSTFTYSLVGGAGSTDNGSFTISGNTLRTAASFDYESKNSYSIRVRSTDNGGLFFEQVFTINVTDVAENAAPVAINDSFSTNEDTAATINVLGNDSDADGDPLSVVLLSGPTHGTLTLNANDTFTYTPAANYNGSDSFTYKVNDGTVDSNVATVNLTVNAVNDAPVANGQSVSTNEDTAKSMTLAANDVEADRLTYIVVSLPAHGTLSGTAPNLTYTPNANYNGSDSFTFKANDGTTDSNVATVSITVNAVNDAPTAANDSYSTNEDTVLTISAPGILGNDSDIDGNTLSAVLVSGPTHGTLTLNSNGSFTYTPASDYNGPDSFSYKANDDTTDSNVATANITVNAVNDAPSVAVTSGGACLADFKGQANLTVDDVETTAGSLTLSATSSNTSLVPNGTISFGGSGANRTVTIMTASGKSGNATITIKATDGGNLSSTTMITVIAGGNNNDTLNGTSGADMLFGGNSQDTLKGNGGNDLLCAGQGDDTLTGGDGADTLDGGQGQDKLDGGAGNDTLLGGQGDDQLTGGDGQDTLRAGDGNDKLDGGANNDQLYGEQGDDTLTGGTGADLFDDGPNNDRQTDFNASQGDTQVNIP